MTNMQYLQQEILLAGLTYENIEYLSKCGNPYFPYLTEREVTE